MSSYAEIVLKLFNLSVPQRIGSVSTSDNGATISVCPKIGVTASKSAARVFGHLEELFAFLIASKSASLSTGDDRAQCEDVLSELKQKVSALVTRITSPVLLRCVIVHEDLHAWNILAKEDGSISGVIDWELHCIKPTILGAQYPDWLLYDGMYDVRFASPNNWWLESPDESARLRYLFEEVRLVIISVRLP